VSLARDYLYSDHFGTIIEVGPAAPQCNPATAKADPHLWRVPNSMPLPDANRHGFDKEAGVHDGNFPHGGANEWFFIKDPGAFDIINEGSAASMNGVIVEAFLANDLSDPIAIADSTQHVDGFLPGSPGCNKEVNDAAISNQDPEKGGMIADACAGADTRVTYRVPQGGLYLRIVPADPLRRGKRCDTCTGKYHMRFRERTCRAPKEAVAVSSGFFNGGVAATEKGWFGKDQRQCWFQVELQAPTSSSDFQRLTIANIGSESNQRCVDNAGAGGRSSKRCRTDLPGGRHLGAQGRARHRPEGLLRQGGAQQSHASARCGPQLRLEPEVRRLSSGQHHRHRGRLPVHRIPPVRRLVHRQRSVQQHRRRSRAPVRERHADRRRFEARLRRDVEVGRQDRDVGELHAVRAGGSDRAGRFFRMGLGHCRSSAVRQGGTDAAAWRVAGGTLPGIVERAARDRQCERQPLQRRKLRLQRHLRR